MVYRPDDPAGSQLGNYRIERLIERGGFAAVYLASDVRPQLLRSVALKVLNEDLAQDPSFRDRFLRESLLAVSLDHHASIVPVYDAGETDGFLWIAMRYIEGADLKRVIEEKGPLAPEFVASVVSQVAGALDVAHAAGLVHRDVKPGNILMSKDMQRAYLADFGLTKKLNTDQALTQAKSFLGTTYYSPPEQFDGSNVGPAADVYALGAVTFHALTGRPPFEGTAESIIAADLTKPVPSVVERRPGLPSPIDSVMARAMAKEPEERYRTAGELAAEVSRVVGGGASTQHDLNPSDWPAPLAGAGAGSGQQTIAATQPPSGGPATFSSPPPTIPPPPGSPASSPIPPPPVPAWQAPPPPSVPPSGPPGPPGAWPPAPSQGPTRSNRLPIILGAAAVVIALAVAGVLVATGGDDGQPDPPPTPPTPAKFPDSEEEKLLATLPASFKDRCDRTEDPSGDGVEAAVTCDVNAGATKASFVLLDSLSNLSVGYDRELEDASVTLGRGDCSDTRNVSHSYKGTTTTGRVSCFGTSPSQIVWTDEAKLTLGTAEGTSPTSLYTWWKGVVKRTDEPLTPVETLIREVPANVRSTCKDVHEPTRRRFDGELAIVRCNPRAPGVQYSFYYAFSSRDRMDKAFASIRNTNGVIRDSGIGLNECPGENQYNRGAGTLGSVMCFLDDEDRANIFWTYLEPVGPRLFIMSEGVAIDSGFKSALEFWQDTSNTPD